MGKAKLPDIKPIEPVGNNGVPGLQFDDKTNAMAANSGIINTSRPVVRRK